MATRCIKKVNFCTEASFCRLRTTTHSTSLGGLRWIKVESLNAIPRQHLLFEQSHSRPYLAGSKRREGTKLHGLAPSFYISRAEVQTQLVSKVSNQNETRNAIHRQHLLFEQSHSRPHLAGSEGREGTKLHGLAPSFYISRAKVQTKLVNFLNFLGF